MIALLMILIPLFFAPVLWLSGACPARVRGLLAAVGILHLGGAATLFFRPEFGVCGNGNWIGADSLGRLVAAVTSFLFLWVALHAWKWLPLAREFESGAHGKGMMSENRFAAILSAFLTTMTLVAFSRNFGLLWVAVEATTLASAPLICFHRSAGALEAMWKYLLICSVGIGLALFGTLLLGVAAPEHAGGLGFAALGTPSVRAAFNPVWFKAAFIFCFAGYGLKMGLAPFHTWLPDAHSESPALVSALLSGSLLNCSFLGIVRIINVAPPELAGFCREFLIGFGMLSLVVAALFIIGQSDYKRMLAYSSVEHMGLLALFWGLGETGAAMIHLMGHSICKMMLFLVAGNILLACGTRRIDRVRGLFRRMPGNATVWLAGVVLICGMPVSPLFFTEYRLAGAAGPYLGGAILVLLFVIFCGMTLPVLKMTMGREDASAVNPAADRAAEKLAVLPALLLLPLGAGGIWLIQTMIKGGPAL